MLTKVLRSDEEWRRVLTPEQYLVTQKRLTEPPFTGRYYNYWQAGTYHCVRCRHELFSSEAKFASDTGWPSFSSPISPASVRLAESSRSCVERTEVSCQRCDAHLGYVYRDGPPPTGLRYSVNSVALKFARQKAEAFPSAAVPVYNGATRKK